MFNNACVQILQKMDKSELKALKAFINQREPQKKQENSLFNYLYRCYPEFKAKDLDPGKIISIFKDNTWANPGKRLSNIGNNLTKIISDVAQSFAWISPGIVFKNGDNFARV